MLGVDDELDTLLLVQRMLTMAGANVTLAASAAEAVDWLRREKVDVLISDISMPGEDGYSLIKRVRASTIGPNANIPAAALTAYARAQDRSSALDAGFQMHLVKPIDPHKLITIVADLAA